MKKTGILLFMAMLVSALLCVCAYAEELTVEGESYTRIGYSPFVRTTPGFSGTGYLETHMPFTNKDEGVVEYDFNLKESGYYGLEVVASIVGMPYTTDYSVSVNDSAPVETATDGVFIENVTTPVQNNVFKRYNVGNFYFKKGKNTVRFTLNTGDLNTENYVVFFLDYFRLVNEPFAINSVKTGKDLNIFENGDRVRFDIAFKGLCPADTVYHFKIVDFWGSTVSEGDFECRPGSDKHSINAGKLETGWYKLCLTDKNGGSAYRDISFAVVPKESERMEGDSPFAADVAGNDLVGSSAQLKKLAKAARMAGVKYVRERYSWLKIQDGPKADFDFSKVDEYINILSGEGLKISDVFSHVPEWTTNTSLFDLYNAHKASAKHFDGKVQTWESYNEVDGNFAQWSGDVYAAMFKAAALGVKDSGADARTAFAGFCLLTEGNTLIDLVRQNDVMRYSDIYNLHGHVNETNDLVQDISVSHLSSHRELKILGSEEAKPFWITEAGIYQPMQNGALTNEQLHKQARYLVTSTTESLATGTSRHFWFVWPPYVENNNDMGVFTKNYEPMPGYEAEAVMTYVLGKGTMKGVFERGNAVGYLFDSGRGDVLTLWTDEPRDITLNSNADVKITDMMGHERIIPSVDGKVTFGISHYPVYVSYNGEMPKEDYYPKSYNMDESLKCDYTDAERVILMQDFDQDQAAVKKAGYKLRPGKEEQLNLVLYNFNNKEMKGKLHCVLDGYEARFAKDTVTIPAMSEITVPVTLVPLGEPDYGSKKYLKFYADFNGEESSPTVSLVYMNDNRPETPAIPIEGADDETKWDINNITAGAIPKIQKTGDTLTFKLKFNGGGKWFYPRLDVTNAGELDKADGIMFWVRDSKDNVEQGLHNMFAYLSDGRSYYLGEDTGIVFDNEWMKVKKRWSEFVLFQSPLGAVDIRPFDPTLISRIGIGCNPYTDTVEYEIKDVGYFKDEETAPEAEIEFVSPDLTQVRDRTKLSRVVVSLPDKEYSSVQMMLTDAMFDDFTVEGNTVYADLSGVERGKYILRVITTDKDGYKNSKTIDITID